MILLTIQDLKDFITSVAEVKANGFQSFELMGELDKLEIKNNNELTIKNTMREIKYINKSKNQIRKITVGLAHCCGYDIEHVG